MSGVFVGKLNSTSVKRWLAEQSEREFRDLRYPELRLRAVAKRSKASVHLVLNVKGRTEWEKLGQFPSLCLKTLAADLPSMLVKRLGDSMVAGQCFTVNDVLCWYMERMNNNSSFSDKWRSNVKSAINSQLSDRMGKVVLSDLNFSLIDEQLIEPMLKEGFQPSYVLNVVQIFKTAFAFAAKKRVIEQDPIAGFMAKDSVKVKPKDTHLFETDLSELFSTLSNERMPVRMMFVLMLMFGTRINETRLTRWEHISHDIWVIPSSNSKNTEEHRIPLTDSAKLLLKFYKRWQLKHVGKRAYLFASKRGVVSERTAQEWSNNIRFKHFTSHDLRILFRTIIADLGIDTVVGERLVNHSLPVLLRTYVKSTLDKGMSNALEQYHSYLIDNGFSSVASEILPRSTGNIEQGLSIAASGWL
ncbi:integrase [Parashewanella curva]|uniref:Integrase n=1 Tax=Parashewanella curva TaxID=2338552 RepID=A0A3L8PZZ4_9GAMM|nr:tyrosine-type recombinase/integrase [Parashewanella curva]RLV60987.1 integrase [Parashewanella curva]